VKTKFAAVRATLEFAVTVNYVRLEQAQERQSQDKGLGSYGGANYLQSDREMIREQVAYKERQIVRKWSHKRDPCALGEGDRTIM
jgi:hypothetical protein